MVRALHDRWANCQLMKEDIPLAAQAAIAVDPQLARTDYLALRSHTRPTIASTHEGMFSEPLNRRRQLGVPDESKQVVSCTRILNSEAAALIPHVPLGSCFPSGLCTPPTEGGA